MSKRILIFSTTYFPLVGGAEVAMKEVTDRLRDYRFEMICAKIQPGLSRVECLGNVTVHRVGFGWKTDKYLLPIFGTLRALTLGKFDAAWSLMASYGGFAALTYTWLKPRTRLLLTLQEGDPLEHYAERVGPLQFLHARIFQRANAVQAISRFLATWAKDMGFAGVPEVVPNGVDIERFAKRIAPEKRAALRRVWGVLDEDVLLVTASRLSKKNAVDDLIRALTYLPMQVKAVIAGVGEDHQALLALTKKLGLENRVVFLGQQGHDALPGILQACDIFVRASLSEGLGNAFLEALVAGLPIVGTPVGGIPDFLVDGETGVFCQPRNPLSLAEAVKRLIEAPALRETIVRKGSLMVREQYAWEGIAERINRLLIRLTTSV